MKKSIAITQKELDIVNGIFRGPFKVILFGSRVKGNHQPYSDLDVCLQGNEKISLEIIAQINALIEQSDLPYRVDVVDYYRVSDAFKELILKDGIDLEQLI